MKLLYLFLIFCATAFSQQGTIDPPIFNGTGLNDATSGGAVTGAAANFDISVVIDGTGTPNTFKWRVNSGSFTSGVAITGTAQVLFRGVSIRFAATTGHTLTDSWIIVETAHSSSNASNFIAPGVGAVFRSAESKLRDFISAFDFGCKGDGVADDSACVTAAIQSNQPIYFPDGTYKIDNNPNPLTFTGWKGDIRMSGSATFLCDYPHQGCFEFIDGVDNVFENFSYTYGSSMPTDQCPDHGGAGNCWGMALLGMTNLVMHNTSIVNGYGFGLMVMGGSMSTTPPTAGCTAPQIIGLKIVNVNRDGLHIQNCENAVVADAYINNSGDDSFGFQNTSDRPNVNGLVATNLQSINSLGGCFSLSGTNQAISNFNCSGPSSFGITIAFPGFLQLPWSGTIAHGIIQNVSFQTGGICACGAPALEFFAGTGPVKFDDIIIDHADGVGVYMSTFMGTPPLAPEVQLSNIRVTNIGLAATTSTGGYCYLLNSVTTLSASNLYADSCPWDGFNIFSIDHLYVSGIHVRNASTAGTGGPGGGHALWLNSIGNFMVSDVQVMDTQMTGTSTTVGETSTTNFGLFNGVGFYLASGTPTFTSSSSNVQAYNINVAGNATNKGGVTFGATDFSAAVTVTDPVSATPFAVTNGSSSATDVAMILNNGALHHQAEHALEDRGLLVGEWGHNSDTNPFGPDGMFLYDAINAVDLFSTDPSATACSNCMAKGTRWQLMPQGGMLWAGALPVYANNAAAVAGGMINGDLFTDGHGNNLMVNPSPNPPLTGNVTLSQMANLPALTIIGNNTGGSAVPLALTRTQVLAMLQPSYVQSTLPSLGGGDAGLIVNVTDYNHRLLWNGSAWTCAPGDTGSGMMELFEIDPTVAGWHLYDGSTVNYLKCDGTLGSETLPDLTSSGADAAYSKAGSPNSGPNSAIAPSFSGTFSGSAMGAHSHDSPLGPGSSSPGNFTTAFGTGSTQSSASQFAVLAGAGSFTTLKTSAVSAGTPAGSISGTVGTGGEPRNLTRRPWFRQ